jgi:protein TonB
VNSGLQRLLAAADAPRVRLALAGIAAMAGWAVFLAHFARVLVQDEPAPPASETIEMKLVEIAPPAPERPVSARPHVAAPAREPLQHSVSKQPSRAAQPLIRRESIEPAQQHDVPQRNDPPSRVEPSAEPAREAASSDAGTVSAKAATPSAADASPASSSSSAAPARLLSQPLPVLPDDLRELAYRAEAVARFRILADGTTEIELVKPTANPRLNQILLEALHKWRFLPAMEGGHPIDSQRDVRVHFNVS